MIVDSHFHALSMKKKGIDSLSSNIVGIDVGTEAGDAKERLAILPESSTIFFSLGSGPWCLQNPGYISPDNERDKLLADISSFGADAIGECGFDNHWKYGTEETQRELFMMQVELASSLSLPIIIHTRDADAEIEKALKSSLFKCRGVMHCFSSGPELMRKALDKNLYISFAGNITYKGNDSIRQAAKEVPLDRILVETDAPYLAPIPMRGKPSKPEYTEYTIAFIAEIKGVEPEMLKERAKENLLALLQRDKTVRKLSLS